MNTSNKTALRLKNDLLFKAVFGADTEESKTILIALLNKILNRRGDPIVDLEYKNPFNLRQFQDDKETIMDIKVITDKGILIDIEMQLVWQKDFLFKILYYHAGLIHTALKKGEDYAMMKKTITICISDEVIYRDSDEYLHFFYFMEEKEHFKFSDITCICCIELPKVNRTGKPVEELSPLELSLEYLNYADEQGSDYVNALVQHGGKELEMAQMILEKTTQEEILREQAIAREKFRRDYSSGLSCSYREGKEAGIREGIEKIAKNLKQSGIPIDVITENTGLTREDIETL